MFSKVIASLLALFALLAVAAGCGGGDDSDSLTKAEFRKQADAICFRQEEKKNAALATGYQKASKEGREDSKAEEEVIIEYALPPIAQMVEELAELEAPSGEEDKVEEMVKAFEEEVQKIEDDPAGTREGKVGDFDRPNKLAKGFGLKDCSLI